MDGSDATVPTDDELDRVDALLREWLQDPAITLICGRWADGGIMEIVPEGAATLSQKAYEGRFAGLRDLHLRGQAHHLHLDLARLLDVTYAVVPSVCYGFKPSFEVRLRARGGGGGIDAYGLAVSVRQPYRARQLDAPVVREYFRRLLDHTGRFGAMVGFHADDGGRTAGDVPETWRVIGECYREAAGLAGAAPRSAAEIADAWRLGPGARDAT